MFKDKLYKSIAVFLALTLLVNVVLPTVSYALTSGPSQPEVQSFEPVGTTEMVDLFSGDFTYNIPLFEVPGPNGGYPFNLHYNAGITMDQEASWTGLGWNLNPGSITRQMRGLPDEYNGDVISHTQDMKANVTFGIGFGETIEPAGADLTKGKATLGLNLGASVYYNSYKGVGYSADIGMSVTAKSVSGGPTAGLGLKIDSQNGVGVDASLSLQDKGENSNKQYSLGIGFNSRSGVSLSSGVHATTKGKTASLSGVGAGGGTSTLSFFSGGYTPGVSMPMGGFNLALSFKAGEQEVVVSTPTYVDGYFSSQKLKNAGQVIATKAYGYLNLHNADLDSDVMMDVNREKDGMVRNTTPNLPLPGLTCDVYNITGQGLAGMFRGYRNDIGTIHDPHVLSETGGGSLSLEVAAGDIAQVGGSIVLDYSSNEAGLWLPDNGGPSGYGFTVNPSNSLYEPSYFKAHGELTSNSIHELDYIGGDKPARIQVNDDLTASSALEVKNTSTTLPLVQSYNNTNNNGAREPRNMAISFRDNNPKNGIVALKMDGSRYFYKPVNNNTQIECLYTSGPLNNLKKLFPSISIDNCGPTIPILPDGSGTKPKYDYNNTDQYFKKTVMPTYAHSYVIEYILGSDYIDTDNTPGPSDGDQGYWVKFSYNGFNNNLPISYNWRIPYTGANYIPGHYTTFQDDKGSYTYGTKEVYYLTQVETASHKAVFTVTDRDDARGANGELQNQGSQIFGATSKKLDKIELYSKSDKRTTPVPIKTVNFQYTYDLCPGVYNNANNGGKLTLAKLWFTYENNSRGSLSPYQFDYHAAIAAENPSYDPIAYDRWGNYKPRNSDICHSIEAMYVPQFDVSSPESNTLRTNLDTYSAAWSLKTITLPSGGQIDITYEADDYAYVQNKTATQMYSIAGVAPTYSASGNGNDIIEKNSNGSNRYVYFKLEKPIPTSTSDTKTAMSVYVNGLDQLYFRTYMYVRGTDDQRQDYISGYVGIEDYNVYNDPGSIVNNAYTIGYIKMKPVNYGTGYPDLTYHPISLAAWQYIRTDEPQLSGIGPFDTDPNSNKSAALDKVKSLLQPFNEIITLLQGFNKHAYDNDWGRKVILDRSYIKLNSPDKIKIGGGHRVKKITLTDNWNNATGEPNAVYGQVYDYTTTEDGNTISSGVAGYEPSIGADENPLRKAKSYVESIPFKTDNNLFFEFPINESYYPAASVGYRKITVMSLATSNEKANHAGFLTTGATVHEFYTAKEFPVVSDQTEPISYSEDYYIPLPLVGQLTSNKMTISQGYSTILNDMHGKPKKISNYNQDSNGNINYATPESYVEYLYSSKTVKQDADANHDYLVVSNALPVLVSDSKGSTVRSGQNGIENKVIGQDYEFFTDLRWSKSVVESGGLALHVDITEVGVPVPFPFPWPNLSRAVVELKMAVTNKIIYRFGVQTGTIAYDGTSRLMTQNILYSNTTGEPLLTSVSNDFDDPIYNYNIPGHFSFDAMGQAYLNLGMKINLTINNGLLQFDPSNATQTYQISQLVAGDELISADGTQKIVFVKNENNTNYYFRLLGNNGSDNVLTATSEFFVTRSGRRNLLNSMIGNIKTLGDKSNPVIGDPTLNANRNN